MGVKTVTRTVLVLAVVLCVSSCLVGRYMCNYSLLPAEHGNDLEGDRTKTESRYPGIIAWYDSLHNRGVFRDTTLIDRGERLSAACGLCTGVPSGRSGGNGCSGAWLYR